MNQHRSRCQPVVLPQGSGHFREPVIGDGKQDDIPLAGAGQVGGPGVPAADETGGGQRPTGIPTDHGAHRVTGFGQQAGDRLAETTGADKYDPMFHCTHISRYPTCSISANIRSPLCTGPTPDGVPVRITSPSSKVKISDTSYNFV